MLGSISVICLPVAADQDLIPDRRHLPFRLRETLTRRFIKHDPMARVRFRAEETKMRITLLSIVLVTFLLGGCASQPTMSQTPSPERPHSGSFGKSDY
jgi:hypothetical protein